MAELPAGELLVVQGHGRLSILQVETDATDDSLSEWVQVQGLQHGASAATAAAQCRWAAPPASAR